MPRQLRKRQKSTPTEKGQLMKKTTLTYTMAFFFLPVYRIFFHHSLLVVPHCLRVPLVCTCSCTHDEIFGWTFENFGFMSHTRTEIQHLARLGDSCFGHQDATRCKKSSSTHLGLVRSPQRPDSRHKSRIGAVYLRRVNKIPLLRLLLFHGRLCIVCIVSPNMGKRCTASAFRTRFSTPHTVVLP